MEPIRTMEMGGNIVEFYQARCVPGYFELPRRYFETGSVGLYEWFENLSNRWDALSWLRKFLIIIFCTEKRIKSVRGWLSEPINVFAYKLGKFISPLFDVASRYNRLAEGIEVGTINWDDFSSVEQGQLKQGEAMLRKALKVAEEKLRLSSWILSNLETKKIKVSLPKIALAATELEEALEGVMSTLSVNSYLHEEVLDCINNEVSLEELENSLKIPAVQKLPIT